MNVRRLLPGDSIPVGLSAHVLDGEPAGYYQLYFRPTADGPTHVTMLFYDESVIAFKREVTRYRQ